MNRIQFGIKYPTAITEALISITYPGSKVERPQVNNIILKVGTGASVSLAHSDYLTIRDCRLQGLPPVRLNGIGGNTGIICKVGILNIAPSGGMIIPGQAPVQIKCYAFDSPSVLMIQMPRYRLLI